MENYKEISTADFDKVLSAFEDGTREQACSKARELFPLFDDTDFNEGFLDNYTLEQYGYYRSIGLTVTDTSYAMQLSNFKTIALLNGEGLKLEKFVSLIKQELFSRAECKAKLLKDIREATGTKQWRTSLTLLEKLYPDEFGSRGGGIEERLERMEENAWIVNIVNKSLPAKED